MDSTWEKAVKLGDRDVVRVMLDAGADVNGLDRYGQSGLMLAAHAGHRAVVELLVANGADLDVTAKFGLSAVMLAVVARHEDTARLLAQSGADLSLTGSGAPGFADKTARDLAIANGMLALAAAFGSNLEGATHELPERIAMTDNKANDGFEWQVGIWDRMVNVYASEIDARFEPVTAHLLSFADLEEGQTVMDLGSGTGAVSFAAAARVGATGRVTAVDISPDMLARASAGAQTRALSNIDFSEGRAEDIPAGDESQDAVLASLSLMYVIDRAAAAREIARVLRPGGRLVAAVWSGAKDTDIVRFQQTAGSFAPEPPVPGVGPGALADPTPFVEQLKDAGLTVECETRVTEFEFKDFESAWRALAAVTTAGLDAVSQEKAKAAVREIMWHDAHEPKTFRNATHYIIARRSQ